MKSALILFALIFCFASFSVPGDACIRVDVYKHGKIVATCLYQYANYVFRQKTIVHFEGKEYETDSMVYHVDSPNHYKK
jgi:hypothetical protein